MTSSVARKWEVSGFCLRGNPPGRQKLFPSTVLSPVEESNKTFSMGIAGFCLRQKFSFLLESGFGLVLVYSHLEIFSKSYSSLVGFFLLLLFPHRVDFALPLW